MSRRFGLCWLPSFLRWSTLLMAMGLVALVIGSPVLDQGTEEPVGWQRLVAVFAHDLAMRRTAIAGAVGLVVAACVFFKPARPRPDPNKQSRFPPPTDVVGA